MSWTKRNRNSTRSLGVESFPNVFIVKAWVSDSAGRTSLDWIRVQFNYEESDNDDSQWEY